MRGRDDDLEPIHTTKDLAERMNVRPDAIRTAIARGELRASMPFGRQTGYRITESWVREWLEKTSRPTDSRPRGDSEGPSSAPDAGE